MTIGLIVAVFALAACLYLAQVHRIRRDRRKRMGLPRIESNWSNVSRGKTLPRREKDWRNDPAVAWSEARYYNRVRGRSGKS